MQDCRTSSAMWKAGIALFIANVFVIGYGLSAVAPPPTIVAELLMREPRLLIAAVVGIGAVIEEFLFRKWLLVGLLSDQMPTKWALVVHAVIFALPHLWQGWGGVVNAFFAGLAFGMIYLGTRKLWIVIVLHAAYNVTVVLLWPVV